MNFFSHELMELVLQGRGSSVWFGDGEPLWTQGQQHKPPKSSAEAYQERLKLIKVLERNRPNYPAGSEVRQVLRACTSTSRCMSGACPECMRAFQRWFVASTANYLRDSDQEFKVASLIDEAFKASEGRLTREFRSNRYRKKIENVLIDAGIKTALIGIDFSMNEHRGGAFQPHWQPHLWVIAPKQELAQGNGILRYHLRRSENVPRPVMIKAFNGDNKGIAYTIKTDFQRRISLPKSDPQDVNKARRNTRDRDLKSNQKTELAILLHKLKLRRRLLTHGLRYGNN